MRVNITLNDVISEEELSGIYEIFCECYDIEIDEMDKKRFLVWHYDSFLRNGNLDHRPFMGAKFFGSGRDGNYSFHGYNDDLPKDKRESSGEEFKRKLGERFPK